MQPAAAHKTTTMSCVRFASRLRMTRAITTTVTNRISGGSTSANPNDTRRVVPPSQSSMTFAAGLDSLSGGRP
jgi:hypothetical protein